MDFRLVYAVPRHANRSKYGEKLRGARESLKQVLTNFQFFQLPAVEVYSAHENGHVEREFDVA